MAYSPYFDTRLRWSPPGWAYQDLYAVYKRPDGSPEHPEWVLHDAAGRPLFIPWGCQNGTCPQYAADVTNPAFRADWIARAKAVLARGYRGLWIDDVNLDERVSDGTGAAVAPVDAAGHPIGVTQWRTAMADFVAQVRAALPGVEIVHNAIWSAGRAQGEAAGTDPQVRREIAAADRVNLERGCSDFGLTGGTGAWSLSALLAYADRVHRDGRAVVWQPYDSGRPDRRETNAACLLLARGRGDMQQTSLLDPADAWPGYALDPGAARGPRRHAGGVWTRAYAHALAVMADPGSPVSVPLPAGSWRALDGTPVASPLPLAGGTGRVLVRG
jgi:hypothetical protein